MGFHLVGQAGLKLLTPQVIRPLRPPKVLGFQVRAPTPRQRSWCCNEAEGEEWSCFRLRAHKGNGVHSLKYKIESATLPIFIFQGRVISGCGILCKIYSGMLLILMLSLSFNEQVRKKKEERKMLGGECISGVGSRVPSLLCLNKSQMMLSYNFVGKNRPKK